ncbi:MAG: PEP-CTERM sorting domain-containing protein, partial [Fimbriimonadales bacterium]
SAPAIGFSDTTYFWENNSGTWGKFNFGATPSGNMRMSLTAVPEPASMAVLGIGALALIRRRRRR